MLSHPDNLSLKWIFLWALVLAFGASSMAQAVTNVIDRFDPAGIGANTYSTGKITNVWKNWFGGAFSNLTWDATMDANTNVSYRSNLAFSVSGGTLTLNWSASHLGWTLQTNSMNLASLNSWFDHPGSTALTNVSIAIDPTKANVFYRLINP